MHRSQSNRRAALGAILKPSPRTRGTLPPAPPRLRELAGAALRLWPPPPNRLLHVYKTVFCNLKREIASERWELASRFRSARQVRPVQVAAARKAASGGARRARRARASRLLYRTA